MSSKRIAVHPVVARLSAARKRQRMTLAALGARLGMKTYQGPWSWEVGRNDPRLSSLDRWAGALGYRPDVVPVDRPDFLLWLIEQMDTLGYTCQIGADPARITFTCETEVPSSAVRQPE